MTAYGRPSASNTDSRPQYPHVEEEIGEDPARYLHNPDMTTWARIRGLETDREINAWIQVEEDIGPRREVMKRLNQRRAELREQTEDEEDSV